MVKEAITGIMLMVLLVNVMSFAAVNPVARATGFNSDLVDYGIFSETEDWWRMFHHDLNHTGFSSSTVPIRLCQHWNTTDIINGSVRSSPAVVGDKVFVGSSDKNVYVLEVATGKKKIGWNYTTDGAVESSPAVVDDMVFVASMNGTVYALRTNGLSYVWHSPIGGAVKSSPAFAEGKVFVGSDDYYVHALDATTGDEIWKFRTAYIVNSSPAVSGGRVFIGVSDGRVYALNMSGRYEWHFPTGGPVESSPTVADGIVFVGSDDDHLYALNETTGEQIWKNNTGGPVESSPAVAYGRVFVGSMNGSIYALNATTGNFLWNFPTEDFVYSSPAVADGKVFVGSGDNRTYVLNATTGFQICNFTTGGPIYSSPAVAKNMVFIGSDDKKVYAFGPENDPPRPYIESDITEPFILQTVTFNGSKSYDPDPDGKIVNCTWDFGDGTVIENVTWEDGEIVTHAYGAAQTEPYKVTLNVTDYHVIPAHRKTNSTWLLVTVQEAWPMYRHDWNRKGYSTSLAPVTNRTLWKLTIDQDASGDLMYSSPAVIDGVVYIGSTNGTVYAINAADGSVIWKNYTSDEIHSSPAVADGMIFIGSDDGNVYALHATNGSRAWTRKTGGHVESSPTIAYDMVFIASQIGKVFAFDKTTGNEEWIFEEPEGIIYSSPAVADGRVYIGSWDQYVYAVNAFTGDPLAKSRLLSDRIQSSPAVAYGRVFIGTMDGTVYALNATDLEVLWSHQTGGPVDSSPAVASGMVFVGSDDGNVYAFNATTDKPTGELIWEKPIGSVGWSSPAVAECKVFVGSTDGKIYALHKEDGTKAWSYQTGGPVDSSPAVLSDTLYVASKNGKLYAFWNKTHDIAVINVICSPTVVEQNKTATINIFLWNKGSFNETDISITASYNSTDFNKTSISVTRGEKLAVQIPWNTTNIPTGNYVIGINATLAPPIIDEDSSDNNKTCHCRVAIGVHNIRITDVIPSTLGINLSDPIPLKNIVGQNLARALVIYVTVENEGTWKEENITVTVYWSNSTLNQTIGNTTIQKLLNNTSQTVNVTWTTTDIAKGNYTISAYAHPVPHETDTTDNNFTNGQIKVGIPGDINGDGTVNYEDIYTELILRFMNKSGDPCPEPPVKCYTPNADINSDGRINMQDIYIAIIHYMETDP